ncbi:MAG TPA: hypothetical protein VNT23_00270, partial [Gaiellaceae bacterium]|nr:hypothetical protein [Gaiellaceae bacterium]
MAAVMDIAVTPSPPPPAGAQPGAGVLPRGWQSRRASGLGPAPSALLLLVVLAAVLVCVAFGVPDGGFEWTAFAALTTLGAIAKLASVSVGRNSGRNTAIAFVLAGTLLLPPLLIG